jgi:glycosyltransferase involved in cell wall biosynthesis
MDLVILGEGPLEGALRRRAADLGVGERVRFLGFQGNPWAWFARARLFVLPSRWEGFGNVVAEALACGAPTLVTDCDYGPREQVVHGVSGWVTRSEDPAALTAALDILLADPRLAARLAVAGRARARAFDIDTIAEAYTELFLEQGSPERDRIGSEWTGGDIRALGAFA